MADEGITFKHEAAAPPLEWIQCRQGGGRISRLFHVEKAIMIKAQRIISRFFLSPHPFPCIKWGRRGDGSRIIPNIVRQVKCIKIALKSR